MFEALRNLKEKHDRHTRMMQDEASAAMNEAFREFLHEYRSIDAIVAKRTVRLYANDKDIIYVSVHVAGGEWLTSSTVVESGLKNAMVDIENSLTAMKNHLPSITTDSFIGMQRDNPNPYMVK